MTGFTREIQIKPSYDYRDDPTSRRGAHGAALLLILRGPLGIIAAEISTGWMLRPLAGHRVVHGGPQVRRDRPGADSDGRSYPSGAYVGSHTAQRIGGDDENGGHCTLLDSDVCYGDGSYLAADEILELVVSGGSDAAFERMESMYRSWIADRAETAGAGT